MEETAGSSTAATLVSIGRALSREIEKRDEVPASVGAVPGDHWHRIQTVLVAWREWEATADQMIAAALVVHNSVVVEGMPRCAACVPLLSNRRKVVVARVLVETSSVRAKPVVRSVCKCSGRRQ